MLALPSLESRYWVRHDCPDGPTRSKKHEPALHCRCADLPSAQACIAPTPKGAARRGPVRRSDVPMGDPCAPGSRVGLDVTRRPWGLSVAAARRARLLSRGTVLRSSVAPPRLAGSPVRRVNTASPGRAELGPFFEEGAGCLGYVGALASSETACCLSPRRSMPPWSGPAPTAATPTSPATPEATPLPH